MIAIRNIFLCLFHMSAKHLHWKSNQIKICDINKNICHSISPLHSQSPNFSLFLSLCPTHKHTQSVLFCCRWAVNPEDAFAADFQGLFSVDMDLQNNDVFR